MSSVPAQLTGGGTAKPYEPQSLCGTRLRIPLDCVTAFSLLAAIAAVFHR